MNLAIDIGNTRTKAAVFDATQIVETFKSDTSDAAFVDMIVAAYPEITAAIVSNTKSTDQGATKRVSELVARCMKFDGSIPVPIKNLYHTPQTLGCDRLAAAVGAATLYPGANVMIADFGTAITVDLVTAQGEFLGGNISPGARSRFRALHEYTGRLPLVEMQEQTELVAQSSESAIRSGVINGIVYEMEGYIGRLQKEYDELRIIFTGGDGNFFAKRLKNTIFATYDLVVYGLNRILEYNAD